MGLLSDRPVLIRVVAVEIPASDRLDSPRRAYQRLEFLQSSVVSFSGVSSSFSTPRRMTSSALSRMSFPFPVSSTSSPPSVIFVVNIIIHVAEFVNIYFHLFVDNVYFSCYALF